MKRRPSAHSSRGVSVFERERICALAGLRLNPGCVDPSWVDDTWDLTGLTDVPALASGPTSSGTSQASSIRVGGVWRKTLQLPSFVPITLR